jgi:hypothetical protein
MPVMTVLMNCMDPASEFMRLDLGFHGLAALVFRLFFARKRVGFYFSVRIEAS